MLMLTEEFIQRELSMPVVIDLMERAFSADAHGDSVIFPPLVDYVGSAHAHFGLKSGFLRLRAGVSGAADEEILGLKAGGYWNGNQSRYGLPNHRATILLIDPQRGEPLALMPANTITRMRTAAAGALAARHLARKVAATVCIVGTGEQAHAQLEALQVTNRITRVLVWGRQPAAVQAYIEAWRHSGLQFRACDDLPRCLAEADIIVTTTPATAPLVMRAAVRAGTHINAVGSDGAGKKEIDPELVRDAKVIVDKVSQSESIGELQGVGPRADGRPLIHATLGEVCTGRKAGRASDAEITLFDSSGVALQDLVVAHHLVQAYRD